jgi:hypothetical protein
VTAIGPGPWSLDDVLGLDAPGAGWAAAARAAVLLGTMTAWPRGTATLAPAPDTPPGGM